MVRTIKRANADDRWKVVSPKDPFSTAYLESTAAEFMCSRGTREKSILLRSAWRGIRLMLSRPDPNRDPVPRRLYLKQNDRSLSRLQSISQLVAVQKVTPKNVEFASREISRKQRKRKPVFVQQPVEWVMLPQGVH